MDEVPDLHFRIRGSDGSTWALKIPGHIYVMQVAGDEAESSLKLLEGIGSAPADSKKWLCTQMFGEMDYKASSNGLVWILGTPLFSECVIGYSTKTSPLAMSCTSQSDKPCGSNNGTPAVNLAVAKETTSHTSGSPRRISVPPRVPWIDPAMPLGQPPWATGLADAVGTDGTARREREDLRPMV